MSKGMVAVCSCCTLIFNTTASSSFAITANRSIINAHFNSRKRFVFLNCYFTFHQFVPYFFCSSSVRQWPKSKTPYITSEFTNWLRIVKRYAFQTICPRIEPVTPAREYHEAVFPERRGYVMKINKITRSSHWQEWGMLPPDRELNLLLKHTSIMKSSSPERRDSVMNVNEITKSTHCRSEVFSLLNLPLTGMTI